METKPSHTLFSTQGDCVLACKLSSLPAISVIVASIALYFFLKNIFFVAACSLSAGGGLLFITGILYSIFHIIKQNKKVSKEDCNSSVTSESNPHSKNTDSTNEDIKVEKSLNLNQDLIKEPREELIYSKKHQYNSQNELLEKYCYEIGDQKTAENLFLNVDAQTGDYCLIKNNSSFTVFYWEDGKIKTQEIHDPYIWNGQIYSNVYEKLKYPLLIPNSNCNRSEVHNSLIGYKNRAFMLLVDGGSKINFSITSIGVIQRFLKWINGGCLENNFRFDPYYIIKTVGHVFNLKGSYSYEFRPANHPNPTNCKVDFEGFDNQLGRSIIMEDMTLFCDKFGFNITSEVKTKIKKMAENAYVTNSFDNPSLDTLWNLLEQDIPITILTGWEGHSVNITLTKNQLIYSNRGDGCNLESGQHMYNIKTLFNKQKLNELLNLLNLNDQKSFPSFKGNEESPLELLLNLSNARYFPMKAQIVGNCVFASNRSSLKSALLLLLGESDLVRREYKSFISVCKRQWIHALKILIEAAPDQNLRNELFFFLYYIVSVICIKSKSKKKELTVTELDVLSAIRNMAINFNNETKFANKYLPELIKMCEEKNYHYFDGLEPRHHEIIHNYPFT